MLEKSVKVQPCSETTITFNIMNDDVLHILLFTSWVNLRLGQTMASPILHTQSCFWQLFAKLK